MDDMDLMAAEAAVIGTVLSDPSAYDHISHLLQAVDFCDSRNRTIWAAIDSMMQARQPVDVVTVADHLDRAGKAAAVGGIEYLTSLMLAAPAAANVMHYARLVHDRASLRHLARMCDDIAAKCRQRGHADADSMILEAETRIHRLASAKHLHESMLDAGSVLTSAIAYIDDRQSGHVATVRTGISHLDRITGGLLRGSMTVIGARPSQGKTALGLTMASGAIRHGHRVAFVSIEMPTWQIGVRLLSMESGIPVQDLMRADIDDNGWGRLTAHVARLKDAGLYVSDQSVVTIPMLRAIIARQKRLTGLDMVIVDYLQLMEPPKLDSREQQVAHLSRGLKAVAKDFDVAVVVMAQLNRDAAGRRPRMSDIRESGAVEQDADMVILIHREDKDGQPAQEVDLLVEKNRNGETCAIRMCWHAELAKFENYDTPRYSYGVA